MFTLGTLIRRSTIPSVGYSRRFLTTANVEETDQQDNGYRTHENNFLLSIVEPTKWPAAVSQLEFSKDLPLSDLKKRDTRELVSILKTAFNDGNNLAELTGLDILLAERIKNSPANQVNRDDYWSVCLAFFHLNSKYSLSSPRKKTIDAFVNHLLWEHKSLDDDDFMRLLFLLNIRRYPLPKFFVPILEVKISQIIDSMTISQVAVAMAAFFKTQTRFRDREILQKVIRRMSETDLSTIDSRALNLLLKPFRSHQHPTVAPIIRKFIASLKVEDVDKLNYMTLMQLCAVSANYLQYNKNILELSLRKVTEQADGPVRLKDFTEILRVCYEFDHRPTDETFQVLIKDVQESTQKLVFPIYFVRFIMYCVSLGVLPETLVATLFEPRFLRHLDMRAQSSYRRDVITIQTIISIEHPTYLGPLLSDAEFHLYQKVVDRVNVEDILGNQAKGKTDQVPIFSFTFKKLFEVAKRVFGHRVIYSFVIPYSNLPVIVILPEGRTKEWFEGLPLRPGHFDGITIFYISNQTHFSDILSTRMKSLFATQIRLLEKLGFNVVKIHWSDLIKIVPAFEDKLRKLVDNKK